MTRWRSMLFVPANRPDLAAKAPRSAPDLIVLDLEDAVPPQEKDAARLGLGDAVAAASGSGTPVAVRVNPVGSSWFDDDLGALPPEVVAVVVPKLDTADAAAAAGAARAPVVAGIETVRGVATAPQWLSGGLAGCYFGAEDYVADLGGVRTPGNEEVATARALVGMAARLAGIPALDMVTLDFGDDDRYLREAAEARALGYAGKLCIHPAQVALAHRAFTPTREELDRARRLLAAYDGAVAAGRATLAFEGEMVDEVVAKRARAVLELAPPDQV